MKTKHSIFFLIFIFNSFSMVAQEEYMAEDIANKLLDFNSRNPIEKVYLDLDKSSYISGETIYFKSYTVSGFYNQLSPLSKIIHVELWSSKGELKKRFKIESDFGIGVGHIDLPKGLITDNYLIKAYTKWMMNKPDFVFKKELLILNLFEDGEKINIEKNEKKLKIDFFPESGYLVNGIASNIAFKATDEKGKSIAVQGQIVDEKNNVITNFTSIHEGMGSFSFIPRINKTYFAQIDGYKQLFPLPIVKSKGQVLTLINTPVFKDIRFQLKNTDEELEKVLIVIHSRGLPTVANISEFQDNNINAVIPKNILQPGINHLTVFNLYGQPLVERLFFLDSLPELSAEIKFNQTFYGKREKVVMELSVADKGKPVEGYFSISVTNDNNVMLNKVEDNLISNLFITSELNGKINNPRNYIKKYNSTWKKQELLMLTHGWSRFKWNEVINSETEFPYPMEQGMSIKGQIIRDILNKPVANAKITYTVKDGSNKFEQVIANENGEFIINDLYFTDKRAIVLDAKNNKGSDNVKILLDTTSHFEFLKMDTDITEFNETISDEMLNYVNSGYKRQEINAAYEFGEDVMTLREVEIKRSKYTEVEKVNNIYGKGDNTILASEILESGSYNHPLELLKNRVAGVHVVGNIGTWSVSIRGVGSLISETTPTIFVDNVEVPLDVLNTIPASHIQSIEVYKGANAAIFGAQGANGVISFFTKNGLELLPNYKVKNVAVAFLNGYQKFKEFPTPNYSNIEEDHSKPDKRAAVYWTPLVETDKNGNAVIEFYTTDETMDLTFTIEGMNRNGKVLFKQFNKKLN